MRWIPISSDQLGVSAPWWTPFIESIAKRQRCSLEQRLADITSGQVRLVLVWDEEKTIATALVGWSEMQRGTDKVARIVWVVGKDRHKWIGLLPSFEQWCRDDQGCNGGMEAIARPGWVPELKRLGYRVTHVQLEKDF